MNTKARFSIPPLLLESGPVSVVAWSAAPGWPVQGVSDSLRKRLGGQRLLGQSLLGRVHPEDRKAFESQAWSLTRNAGQVAEAEFRLLGRDDDWIWVAASISLQRGSSSLELPDWVALLMDVTRNRASEERLQLVIEGTRLGMWDWCPQTGDVSYNGIWANMLGYELSEVAPTVESWSSRVHPDDLDRCYRDIQDHIEGRTDFYQNVHRMRHRDGHWVYILDRGKVVERDLSGKPLRFTGTHTDITEQKRAEVRARSATRAKSLFLANMSHEIRTPLNGILGTLHILATTPLDDDQHDLVEVIRHSGEGLLRIINEILDFSKVEAGEMDLASRDFDLDRLLENVVQLYRESASQKGISLTWAREEALPRYLHADDHRLEQVLSNLVSNGIKFTQVGAISIGASQAWDEAGRATLRLSVRDTGKGIADTDLIWQSFRQEEATISRVFGGTGLGLSISRGLVELMGGSIRVESEVGVGSTFIVELPLTAGQAPTDRRRSEPTRSKDALRGKRVLVAEDNAVNQLVARRTLEMLGAAVCLVGDGAAALEALRGGRFDLVLMDVHMPGMDGIEATRRIRASAADDPGRVPIVALTADAIQENRQACLEAGMDAFLPKPFRVEELLSTLASLS